jgi:general secretion pathway protein D
LMTAFADDRRPARRRLFRVARTRGLFQTSLVLILCLLMAAPGLPGASRKAKQLYEQGRRAEVQKDYDGALQLYEQAQVEDPGDNRYQLSVRRMRFVAAQAHVDAGRRLRDDEGLLDEALAHFQRAIEIDPSLTAASQQYQRTLDMIDNRRGGEKKENDDGNASALELDRTERRKLVESMRPPAVLRPLSTQPIDITMSQQLKVVYETIGKLAGINVLFDPDFSDKRVDIAIQDATLNEALNYTALITQTYWKPITHNAIFVTNDTTAKRRDFEEKIVKTIYLNNVATPQELQEIVTAIRGLTDIRRMFPVTSMNALVVRGSRSELALVDKLINDIDKARPEVVIDVLVLEVSRSRSRELGLSPSSGGVPGISIPLSFTGGTDGAVNLSQVAGVGTRDWTATLPGAQLTALFSSSDSNLLQSPRIRATDNQQASLRIGERIPIATGSFQPGIGGVGANALVNTQFNFEEVGVNIDILPKVHNNREISMHLSIEVSNVRAFQDLGGIQQPIISQKTIEHDIRLEEGEASILGGLNQDSVFTTKSGIPFLAEIPILGRLFSVKKVDTAQNEILIVVIPHIVRLPTVDASNLLEIASGTEQVFQVGFKEKSSGEAALPAPGAPVRAETPTPATPATQTPGAPTPPAAVPGPATPGSPATPGIPPAATPTPTEQPATPAQPAAASRLLFQPGQTALAAGEETTVSVLADGVTDLFGSPLRIAFDPAVVNIVEITRGGFLAGPERTDLIFSRNIRNQVGQAAVNISRFPGTGGATGRGELIQIRLRGVAAGQTQLNVSPTGARRADGNPMNLQAASLQLTVQ